MSPPESKTQSLLLNVKDAAALLGVSRGNVRKLFRAGRLAGAIVGRALMIQRASVENFAGAGPQVQA